MSKETKNKPEEKEITGADTAEATEDPKETEEKEEVSEPDELEKVNSELAAQKEAYLRLAAEYDNYRKRTAKEKEDTFTNAKATVFEELLPVLDNFERALAAGDTSLEDFKKGIDMTYSQLMGIFEKFGVKPFCEAGEQFDPNFHNAVMHDDDPSLEANVITEVFQKGYKIGEKVLRHAMVKVAN